MVRGLWWEGVSLSRSWSPCGRSVRARVWPGVAVPWLLGSPRRPVMMSPRWGPRPQVVDTCVWKCSSPNRPGPAVKGRVIAVTLKYCEWREMLWYAINLLPAAASHLFCVNFDLVVGCGDDDVFGGEVSHVNCELIRIPKSLDVSRATYTHDAMREDVRTQEETCISLSDNSFSMNFHLCCLLKRVNPRLV